MAWRTDATKTVAQLSGNLAAGTVVDSDYWKDNCYTLIKNILNGLLEHDAGVGLTLTATAGDATPTVLNANKIIIPQAVTITDFDDGVEDQVIDVIASVDAVVISGGDAAKIKVPFAGAQQNWTINTDGSMRLRRDATKWIWMGGPHNFL